MDSLITSRRRSLARPASCRARFRDWWIVGLLLAAGCQQNPYVLQGQVQNMQQQQVAISQQMSELQNRAATLDRDNQELQTLLGQSQQQARIHEDQVALLREQLSTATAQLNRVQDTYAETEKKAEALAASVKRKAGASITANSSFRERLPAISIPGVEVRNDGDLVRIELPAARLFDASGARMVPDAGAIIDKVAAEIVRNYPGQIIGVEGHTDSDPPRGGAWSGLQQLSVGRALAVHDYLAARGGMSAGQLFIVGHGPNHPVVSNGTPAGKQRNNRVELVVYPERANQ